MQGLRNVRKSRGRGGQALIIFQPKSGGGGNPIPPSEVPAHTGFPITYRKLWMHFPAEIEFFYHINFQIRNLDLMPHCTIWKSPPVGVFLFFIHRYKKDQLRTKIKKTL